VFVAIAYSEIVNNYKSDPSKAVDYINYIIMDRKSGFAFVAYSL